MTLQAKMELVPAARCPVCGEAQILDPHHADHICAGDTIVLTCDSRRGCDRQFEVSL